MQHTLTHEYRMDAQAHINIHVVLSLVLSVSTNTEMPLTVMYEHCNMQTVQIHSLPHADTPSSVPRHISLIMYICRALMATLLHSLVVLLKIQPLPRVSGCFISSCDLPTNL